MRSCLLQIAPDGTLPLRSAFVQDGLAIGNVLAMEHEQQVRVGRRLAAIVAADVAGYSPMFAGVTRVVDFRGRHLTAIESERRPAGGACVRLMCMRRLAYRGG